MVEAEKWRRHQDTVYWVDIQLAQQKGLKFYQTRSNAINLCDTLPAYRIPKITTTESGEIIYEKVCASLRPPPTISLKDSCMKELDSEVAGGSEDSQQIQPKSKTQLSRTVSPVNAPSLSQSCVPVSVERADKDKDAEEYVDADQTRTERLVSEQPTGLFTQLEELDIDFRVFGLPHAVVKQAENCRVRELVKKIESHPHREALQADLQQNNVYNPFSDNSKAKIREMGNAELFELRETIPKV